MRILPLFLLVGSVLLASCATTRMDDADELALYSSHAGEPVRKVNYREPVAWDTVGSSHLLVTIRPTEGWLLRVAPNCLDAAGTSPAISISHFAGVVSTGFDKVTRLDSRPGSMSCRIEEIRVVDLGKVRDERNAMAANP